jgi:peptide/nickel transport system ATP-binding protein
MHDSPILRVEALSVEAVQAGATRRLVDQLSFSVGAERVALVGESGSGKSLTARALAGLLAPPLRSHAAVMRLEQTDLLGLAAGDWEQLRGARLSLMLQDPRHSLNPVLTIGRQLDLALRTHQRLGRAERRERIATMLESVGLAAARHLSGAYPHQISGGMGQRVVLAMMLINEPRLLIADEPTSALDAALREQVLELMTGLVQTRHMGLLLISHDLQLVARHTQRVLVMARGRLVDECPAAELHRSAHPYTRTLWACRPSASTYGTELPVLDRA